MCFGMETIYINIEWIHINLDRRIDQSIKMPKTTETTTKKKDSFLFLFRETKTKK